MKKLLLASLAAGALYGAPAFAADMPMKSAPPVVATAYDWSGFYIGGDAGWQSSSIGLSNPNFTPPFLTYEPRHTSFALGAFVGAQRQFGQIVLGVEGSYMSAFRDVSLGATPSVSIFTAGGTGTAQAKLKDIWSVGGRAGWAMGQWMPYVTGGYASGSFQFNAQTFTPGAEIEQANARTGGYYIGGGVDWAVWNNWIVGLEYRHYAFSAKTVASTISNSILTTETIRFAPSTDTVLARLSYKFGWPR